MDQKSDYKFKVVLFGDTDVGRNEILNSLCHSKGTNYHPIGASFVTKSLQIYKKQVQLQLWNVVSHDRFFPLCSFYARGVAGAVVVYDITCRSSFENIHRCFSILDRETTVIMLGNKCDMTDRREVTKEEGEKLASEKGIQFLETSAINDDNVEEAFTILARDILLRRKLESFKQFVTPSEVSSDVLVTNTAKPGTKLNFAKSMFCRILRYGVEENYHIRVMLVGNEGVGKSTLLRRLLRKPVKIKKYNSTNGIDVHIHSCDVDIETGAWCFDETREINATSVANLWRYLGGAAKSKLRNETAEESRGFHMRVAKMLKNHRTFEKIKYAQDTVSVKMVQGSGRETEDENIVRSNMQISLHETGDDVPKTDVSKNCEDHGEAFVTPVHPSIDNDDIEAIITKTKSIEPLEERPKARVDFYDFAGQLVFHASHPTFLSSRAIYIMTFDMNKINEEMKTRNVEEMLTNKYGEGNRGTVSDTDSIFFWLNILYMFTASRRNIHPHVILVGTHADKLPKANRDKIADKCFREIRCSLADSPLKHILSDREYMVDNSKKTDPCFAQLQTEIFNLARQQPHWGEQTPSRWLPLEREIQSAKDSGLKVLSIGHIRELNSGLEVNICEDTELDMFLQFLHDTGELLYFNEPTLRDYVVLDPVWLIGALKAVITADQFAIRSPKQADKWKRFCETGIIYKSTIIAIFKENDDPALFENYEHVLRLMEKFLFIASPMDIASSLEDNGDTSAKTEVEYIVPSMVHKQIDTKLITSPEGLSSTTVFCLVSKNNFLPSAVFHKLLAKCISKWQIVDQNGQKQIFCDVCKFNLDQQRHYKLIVFSIKHAVHAKIISYVDIVRPQPAVCKLVHEFLAENLRQILTSMEFSDEFRTCIQCPKFSGLNSGGYLDIETMDNQEFVTCDECKVSHVMQTADLIGCWTDKVPLLSDDESITQTQSPVKNTETEKHATADAKADVEGTGPELFLLGAPITQDHLNHARVCNALVTVCAEGLRDILLSQIPPGYPDFYQLLLARKPALTAMRQFRREQIDIMFPDPRGRYTGTVDQFDITLLYALIRNISSVPAPVTGWGKLPVDNPKDTSLGATTEQVRICRNCVSGHSMDGRLDDQAFENYWKDICLIMDDIEQSLGVKGYQDALKKRKDQILSPKEAQSLRTIFSAFQAEVLLAVETVTEKMRNLQALVEDHT